MNWYGLTVLTVGVVLFAAFVVAYDRTPSDHILSGIISSFVVILYGLRSVADRGVRR